MSSAGGSPTKSPHSRGQDRKSSIRLHPRHFWRLDGKMGCWWPVLISGLRVFARSCDLLTADEPFGLTPGFIAAASRISLRIHQHVMATVSGSAKPHRTAQPFPRVAPRQSPCVFVLAFIDARAVYRDDWQSR